MEENMAMISSEINLPALSTTKVKARFNRQEVKKEGYYIASIANPEFSTHMGGPSLVSICKDKGMYFKVINAGPVDIRLRKLSPRSNMTTPKRVPTWSLRSSFNWTQSMPSDGSLEHPQPRCQKSRHAQGPGQVQTIILGLAVQTC